MSERRILLVGRKDSQILHFLEALTGSLPAHQPTDSHAGISHLLKINNRYYNSDIGIWVDDITANPKEWSTNFCSKEAKDVRTVLGAFIYVFRRPTTASEVADVVKADLKALAEVVKACGYNWDGVALAVAMSSHSVQEQSSLSPVSGMTLEEWEEMCSGFGFEFVDFEAKGRNDYGEPVGMERLREALEANDWSTGPSFDFDDFVDDIDGVDLENEGGHAEDENENVKDGLQLEADEMEREMFGLRQAIYSNGAGEAEEGDSEIQVESLEAAIQKLQAVKEMAAEMPENQRKAFAAKAVADVMKTL